MRRKIQAGRATLRLLCQVDRWAFLAGAATGATQSMFYPLLLLILWKGFALVLARSHDLAHQGAVLLGGLFALLALQHLLRIANETATSILQAESAQHVNARIMGKMAEVPYRLFEDNDFQARYGLLISQASYRPAMLVQTFIASLSALGASLAIAATLFALAPLLVLFLLVLLPLALVETRYHGRILALQMDSASGLFRMMYLTQKSIDATWQRDIRVHGSTVLDDEYRMLARTYLGNLRRLLHRYQLIRIGIGLGVAAIMTLAMGAVFWLISRSPAGPAEAAILLPALYMGLAQGEAFSASWGSLMECVGYLNQVFDFLDQPFEGTEPAPLPATWISPAPVTAGGA